MAIKFGRFGQFLACTNYPECKTTREIAKPANGNGDAATTATGEAAEAEENPYANETCEKCGSSMALKKGRFGPFLACTGYPECKNTRKLSKTGAVMAPPKMLDEKCPECGMQIAIKQGPYGEYTGCTSCKYIKRETTGVACTRAGCKGEIVVKKSKRGKVFYGCSEYPKCDRVYWDKPVARVCPQCQNPFMLEKFNARANQTVLSCPECEYKGVAGEGGELVAAEATAKAPTRASKKAS
jgi:DNA topoisomerase-1